MSALQTYLLYFPRIMSGIRTRQHRKTSNLPVPDAIILSSDDDEPALTPEVIILSSDDDEPAPSSSARKESVRILPASKRSTVQLKKNKLAGATKCSV